MFDLASGGTVTPGGQETGRSTEVGPGDFAHRQPGHDAWIVGDDTCVFIDILGAPNYAKK